MKHRIFSLIMCLAFFAGLAVPVSASTELPLVVDNAELLSETEEQALEVKAQGLRSDYGLDVVILTVSTLDGTDAQNYADTYFDQNGYGYGEDGNGILFLLAMAEREWYISTCGETIYAVTDYGVQTLGETAVWYLSEGDYFDGFDAYLDALPTYLETYEAGSPFDGFADTSGDYYHGDREAVVYYEKEYTPNIFLSLIIGIFVAAVVVLIMRASMNTKRQQLNASGYMKDGSFHLRSHQDMFLYSNVSKVRRQQNNNGGYSGGGSSVHHSSGGRPHGGGGGKF